MSDVSSEMGRDPEATSRRSWSATRRSRRSTATTTSRPAIDWREVESADPARVPQGPWPTWQEQAMTPPPLSYELAWNQDGTQAFGLRRHLAMQLHPEATAQLLVIWAADLEAALV